MRKPILIAALALMGAAGAAYAAEFSAAIVTQPASISSAFGPRANGLHSGADVAAAAGAAVHAPASGRVLRVSAQGSMSGYGGQVVEIDHGEGVKTRFSNLEGVALTAGDAIGAGDIIGRIVANERPHVHVELWRSGTLVDPATEMTLIAAD